MFRADAAALDAGIRSAVAECLFDKTGHCSFFVSYLVTEKHVLGNLCQQENESDKKNKVAAQAKI